MERDFELELRNLDIKFFLVLIFLDITYLRLHNCVYVITVYIIALRGGIGFLMVFSRIFFRDIVKNT